MNMSTPLISATVIADSVNMRGNRITTLELVYPRFIHSEFMTHRVFSRNAASSRAIPLKKQRAAIWDRPAGPLYWGSNKKGMQAGGLMTGWRYLIARGVWRWHRACSLFANWILERVGLHKQYTNRLTEAHAHIKVVVTSTQWANFFSLRAHSAAQPEFQQLTFDIIDALAGSRPVRTFEGGWHLPYIYPQDFEDPFVKEADENIVLPILQMISAARCARVSYTTFENKVASAEADYNLGMKIVSEQPLHVSPLEHQACADAEGTKPQLWGNFKGWIQYRKTYAGENVPDRPYSGAVIEGTDHLKVQPDPSTAPEVNGDHPQEARE